MHVALRFDLTVPFARFMAEHVDELYLPFRRYHMAKVWRGENTQRGRYREFMQCDFDIVGTDATQADADIVLLIHAALSSLGIGAFKVRINHRGLFNRFLATSGAQGQSAAVLRAVDKLDKIGRDETRSLLAEAVGEQVADRVLDFIAKEEGFETTLAKLEALAGGPCPDSRRLRSIWAAAREAGAEASLDLDPSITRGLDYYTGVVFETILVDMPELGSVCGGGRYDELASLYTTRRLPGVGAAIGLDRLLAGMEALGRTRGRGGYASVLVVDVEEELEPRYQGIARAFRDAGLACEIFPEKRKLGQQFAYAEKKGIPFALVHGSDEAARGIFSVKDIATRESVETPSLAAAIELVKARLA